MKKLSTTKKITLISVVLIILFTITNPSSKSFDEFLGKSIIHHPRKTYNWIIFSIYEDKSRDFGSSNTSRSTYIGTFMNFFKLP